MNILLVGCGNMGNALLKGWLLSGMIHSRDLYVIEQQDKAVEMIEKYQVVVAGNPSELIKNTKFAVIVFAVKPNVIAEVIDQYKEYVDSDCLFISIIAGKTLNFFNQNLGRHAAVIRAMPNLASVIRQGMTAICRNSNVSASQLHLAIDLFKTVGKVMEVEDEHLLDPVTALSGSGPAYLFLLAEALTKAALEEGLDENQAKLLISQTLMGSAVMLMESDESSAILRKKVTSPGGTTEAAIMVLNENDYYIELMKKAVKAATAKSKMLSAKIISE